MSRLKIPKSICSRVEDKSSYNYNVWKLPITIDGCDELVIKSDDDMTDTYYINGVRFGYLTLPPGVREPDYFEIDTEDYKNEYT